MFAWDCRFFSSVYLNHLYSKSSISGTSEISSFHPMKHSDIPRLIIILFTRCAAAVYSGRIKSICSLYACVMRWPTYTTPPPSQNKKMDSTFILVSHSGYCSAALRQGGVDNEWENPVNSTARQLSQLSSWILQLMVANLMFDQVSMMTNQRFVLNRQDIGPKLVKKVICVSFHCESHLQSWFEIMAMVW